MSESRKRRGGTGGRRSESRWRRWRLETASGWYIETRLNGASTLPDTDTDTETDRDTDNDKFYTTHFCRSLYRSLCRAVWTHHKDPSHWHATLMLWPVYHVSCSYRSQDLLFYLAIFFSELYGCRTFVIFTCRRDVVNNIHQSFHHKGGILIIRC